MNDTNAIKVNEYRLHFAGLFGRNRKPKHGSVALGDVADGTTMLDLEAKVAAALVEAKAKPGLKWKVVCTPVTIEKSEYDGKVLTSRSFMCFSGVNVLSGVQS